MGILLEALRAFSCLEVTGSFTEVKVQILAKHENYYSICTFSNLLTFIMIPVVSSQEMF